MLICFGFLNPEDTPSPPPRLKAFSVVAISQYKVFECRGTVDFPRNMNICTVLVIMAC